jgi:isopenicillin-N epimerase
MHGALTAFQLPFTGPEKAVALRNAIWQHRIEVPIVERSDRLLIRVSTHFYNTEEEIDRLGEVLRDVLHLSSVWPGRSAP